MAISDLLNRAQTKIVKGPPCTVCALLADLPEPEAAALRALLSSRIPYSELSKGLLEEGVDITPGTLSRHARGLCEARERLR